MLDPNSLSQLRQFKKELQVANHRFEGVVRSTPGRFGFCQLDDGRDIYLSAEHMSRVLPGDRILVEVSEGEKGRLSGTPLELLASSTQRVVGTAVNKGSTWFINADFGNSQRWLFIPPKSRKDLQEGLYITGRLVQHPFKDGRAQVEITGILGAADKPGLQTDYTLHKFQIRPQRHGAPETGRLEALLADEIARRPSRTDTPFLTIDAESTRDIDDALYCETTASGWRLEVGIADPSAFFGPTDPLDIQARERAQTLYFPDRIIGMLPDNLAFDLASLVAGKDRLALICSMDIDTDGSVRDFRLSETTIRVIRRLSYESATAVLEAGADTALDDATPLLTSLRDCTDAMHRWRQATALVSSDRPDYAYRLDAQGRIAAITRVVPTAAHQIVEEAMIAANRCAAVFLSRHGDAGLFSTHDGFRPERLEQVRQIMREQFPEQECHDIESLAGFSTLYRQLATHGGELALRAIANRLLIRGALSRRPKAHFGMGLPLYTTITSPIRRYADLAVHRNLKALLQGQRTQWLDDAEIEQLQERLRLGRQAMNEVEQWMKTLFAETLRDRQLDGHIVHMNGSGFTVRTDEHGIEGLVSLSGASEKFRFDSTYFRHLGSQRSFLLEQPVKVVIQQTDAASRQVVFSLAEHERVQNDSNSQEKA